ncbi:hypothetical protein OPIT5_02515 [Opitutaceae bacterium TAV5]|nr:hypothetical protein OPIT5_02515 [Opitutaceae bacterium TAV5]
MKDTDLEIAFRQSAIEHSKICYPSLPTVIGQLDLLFLYWSRLDGAIKIVGALKNINDVKQFNIIASASTAITDDNQNYLDEMEEWIAYIENLSLISKTNRLEQKICETQMSLVRSARDHLKEILK